MTKQYDVIIIGAGHNGLVSAAVLAGRGLRVLVLERRALVGGACVTEEVFPGFRVSTAAYLVSLLQQRIVDELDLHRFGYQVDPKDPAFFSLFPGGRTLTMWQDQRRTIEEIARFSAKDAAAYPRYCQHVDRLARLVEPLLFVTPPEVPPSSLTDFLETLKLAGRFRHLDRAAWNGLVKIFSQSAHEFLSEWFESEAMLATLATDGVIGANGGPMSPGTAYVLLHHYMGGVGGVRGLWGFSRGGMGAVTQAMADCARSRGAEIRTGASVERVLVRGGQAQGVVLEGGDEIRACCVLSNADPKRTFLGMLAPGDLDPEFRRAIENYRSEGTSLKINLALDGLPDFTAVPRAAAPRAAAPGPGPHHGATMHICPTIEYMERAWDDAKYGRPSERPIIEMTLPTVYDPSLAPPGKHIMGVFVQYAPYTLRQGTWDDLRESFADRVIDCIAEHAPNIRDIVLHRQVLTPLDIERTYGITGGNIFHGAMSPDQMFFSRPVMGWARYATPLRNLYLCGSGAHPGGGVIGAAGYNAAHRVLQDLRR
jgi:phytoene dehydrogenase-like protein